MPFLDPALAVVSVEEGRLEGATGRYEKRLGDLAGLYADAAAFEAALSLGNPVVYDVTEFRPSAAAGDLIFGVTRMSPGRIGDEFFLTRGHIHARADRPEIYYGQKGEGVMLMEAPDGETRTAAIHPQSIVYVPPFWIHRSVNVGTEDLVMVFCYPADAGQDYGIIERSGGMRHRVVAAPGGWALAENPAWTPRSEEAVAAILATAA